MIDTSGFVVMGVGLVSVMVVNLFVNKNDKKCPQSSINLQAYSGPDDFPLPIPDSIYKQSGDSPKVEPITANQLETKNVKHDRVTFLPPKKINEPPASLLPMTNPFLEKLDLKVTYSQDSMVYHSTSKLDWETSSDNSQGDQTVQEQTKTEDTSTSEELSHGDSVSQDQPKDSSSYSSSLSWEDAFVEREPFIDPMKGFYHPKMPGTTKNKKF
uniref:Uncharacterized protein n=1 Tax=Lygus hesperus TaxID=30085 RepID=A0A0A9X0J4_LYGHE